MASNDFQYRGYRFREMARGVVLPLNERGIPLRRTSAKAELAIRSFYALDRKEQMQHKTAPVVVLKRPAACRVRSNT
jgi:hypothetical protein